MQVQFKFRFSEEHLLTSHLRYRHQVWWRPPFQGLKWVLATMISLLLIFAAYRGVPMLSAFFGAILSALLLGWSIDSWIIRKRFRKSPLHNDDIAFTFFEDGAHVVGQTSEVRIGWAAYPKARRFKDGMLLF